MYTALRSLWWRPFWVDVENASKWQTSTVPASIIETIPIEILWSYSLVSQWVDSPARCSADGFELQFTRNTNIPLKLASLYCVIYYQKISFTGNRISIFLSQQTQNYFASYLLFAFKLFPMPVRLIGKDLISRMKCSLPYSWRGWPKISWTSQTIFNQNINSWVTWDSVISHFYVNSSKKGQHSCVTQLSRSVIDFLLRLAVSINYHFTKLKKFKSTHDTVILWTSKSYKLRRRPSQWSENSIVLVHWRFFRLAKEYLSRMPKLESAELLHLRKTNVGHKVNIPHASVKLESQVRVGWASSLKENKRWPQSEYSPRLGVSIHQHLHRWKQALHAWSISTNLSRCPFVVFSYCSCVEFRRSCNAHWSDHFPDLWFSFHRHLLAKRTGKQEVTSICQETTSEEWSTNAQRFVRGDFQRTPNDRAF